jgi:hypothetical protein
MQQLLLLILLLILRRFHFFHICYYLYACLYKVSQFDLFCRVGVDRRNIISWTKAFLIGVYYREGRFHYSCCIDLSCIDLSCIFLLKIVFLVVKIFIFLLQLLSGSHFIFFLVIFHFSCTVRTPHILLI